MPVIIGYLDGEPQEIDLVGNRVYINGKIRPIKDVTEEEIEALRLELENAPEGDEAGREAWRHTRRIHFLLNLLARTFGDECTNYLETLVGNLHYRVLEFLGETEALDDIEVHAHANPPHRRDEAHGHCCGHDHHK